MIELPLKAFCDGCFLRKMEFTVPVAILDKGWPQGDTGATEAIILLSKAELAGGSCLPQGWRIVDGNVAQPFRDRRPRWTP